MMTDHDHGNEDDNEPGGPITPASAGGAIASLAALGKALNSVNTSAISGRSTLPMLQFKREGDGTWTYGQKRIAVEAGSRWAINPLSFCYGYICFGEGGTKLGERLVPVSQPMPNVAELPDHGFPWVEQWCVNLKCLDGADAGIEVTYKPTTVGGLQCVADLIDKVRDRINSGQHGGKVAPVVLLKKDSYPHSQYGRVWTPLLEIVDWMPLSGPTPAPAPTPTSSPAAEQPRRRRVG